MSFKSGFESRELQFYSAGCSEFQVRGTAVLNDRLANDVRRSGMHSSGTDDDRVLRALVRNEICWFRTSDTAEMTSAESWTSARPTYSCCAIRQAANAAS